MRSSDEDLKKRSWRSHGGEQGKAKPFRNPDTWSYKQVTWQLTWLAHPPPRISVPLSPSSLNQ